MARYQAEVAELTETIEALHQEVSHLHRAMRLRALIEQAKGVLMVQRAIGPQAAFDTLREVSQAQNAPLVEVAATVVGMNVPDIEGVEVDVSALLPRLRHSEATSRQWRALCDQPDVQRGRAAAVLDTLAGATHSGRESAQLVLDFMSPLGVSAVSLWRSRPDFSLEQIGQVGYASDTASAWRRLPLQLHLPVTTAARTATPNFLPSEREAVERFPLLDGVVRYEALASLPVVEEGVVIGVIGLSWNGSHPLPVHERDRLADLANRIGRVVLRADDVEDFDWQPLAEMLAIVTDPYLLLRVGDEGAADLTIDSASPLVPQAGEHIGRRLLAVYPGVACDTAVVDELGRLARLGGHLTFQTSGNRQAPWTTRPTRVRAVRAGRRLVIAWHPAC